MKDFFTTPFMSFSKSIIFFLLSFSGSIFMWILSYLYSDKDNLQFGHLLPTSADRFTAVRNLVIASVFYAIVAVVTIYQLILHYRMSRIATWDPSIAMTNVNTPKPDKRHTPTLSAVHDFSTNVDSAISSQSNGPVVNERYRAGTASLVINQ